jgi:hypothetical protein
MRRPHLRVREILSWADAYFAHWDRWPTRESGPVSGQIDITWCEIDVALKNGNRGLPGGSSLPQLLAEQRNVRNQMRLPRWTENGILVWMDAYRKQTGVFPKSTSGAVSKSPSDTWLSIDLALRLGLRGLPGGSSLARLLASRRGVQNPSDLPRLTIWQILIWADKHFRRTGTWPTRDSGPIQGTKGETWFGIANSLFKDYRGLRHDTLARLLKRHRGVRNRKALPPLRIRRILAWADAHFRRTGQWPIHTSGNVYGVVSESWAAIHHALQRGMRELPGDSSLYWLLREHRGMNRLVRNATRVRSA